MALARDTARADPPWPAAVAETHMSVLFFHDDRVLKIRRPVAYSFADFSNLERRRIDCEREVALNRRLAPDVYRGTATLAIDGRAVEYAVVMRRLPDDRNLAALVEQGEPLGAHVRRIASALATFHAGAARSARISASATADALWQRWQATGEELGRFIGPVVNAARYRQLTTLARRYLEGRRTLCDRRIAEGAVCDGHGDLQAADIFCLDDGPRILDCLEFDDELRYGDVLADVAFLAEDLERLGAPQAATDLVEEYRRRSGRDQPRSLLHFYIAARAHVRLLVDCLRQEQRLSVAASEPTRLLELAVEHLELAQPRLIMVGGLPGSGKSTLAEWLGKELDAPVLSTDHARKQAGPSATGPSATGPSATGPSGAGPSGAGPSAAVAARYGDAARSAVYGSLCDRAAAVLRTGRSVVFDATWTAVAMRKMAVAAARGACADLVELRCECAADVRAIRVLRRMEAGTGESDATPAVADAMAATEDPWPTAARVDTSGSPEESRRAAAEVLSRQRSAAAYHALGNSTARREDATQPQRPG
jgi:uncharacterized protein